MTLAALQGALARTDLARETALLERLLYKNKQQHRGSLHFRRLMEAGPPFSGTSILFLCPPALQLRSLPLHQFS